MSAFRVLTAAEQVVEHLRGELARGTWSGTMPGGDLLAKQLGIGRNTIEGALKQLEKEGLLVNQGSRRRRLINSTGDLSSPSTRVAILLFEPVDAEQNHIIKIKHMLKEAGHSFIEPDKSLIELGMDTKKLAKLVDRTTADAWVIVCGSKEVLEWFADRPEPAFALFGRRQNVPISSVGPGTALVMTDIAQRLVELGHRRIVLVSRKIWREPKPAEFVRAFLSELDSHNLAMGSYNLPDWEESRRGFHQLLESLFKLTPPTALIVEEPPLFTAVLRFLAGRGIRTPEDISLICTDPNQHFHWCESPTAHIQWDIQTVGKTVVRWVDGISRGNVKIKQTLFKAEFIEGGTVGPARS